MSKPVLSPRKEPVHSHDLDGGGIVESQRNTYCREKPLR